MGIFEESQSLKSIIEMSENIMGNLRIYAQSGISDCGLPYLGGRNNIHYRIGKLESGLWIASRENLIFSDGTLQRIVAEHYTLDLECSSDYGRKTPSMCIGVRAHIGDAENDEDRFFLLLEDLTKGGEKNIKPAGPGEEYGFVDADKVYYDFDDREDLVREFKFMADKAMIHLYQT